MFNLVQIFWINKCLSTVKHRNITYVGDETKRYLEKGREENMKEDAFFYYYCYDTSRIRKRTTVRWLDSFPFFFFFTSHHHCERTKERSFLYQSLIFPLSLRFSSLFIPVSWQRFSYLRASFPPGDKIRNTREKRRGWRTHGRSSDEERKRSYVCMYVCVCVVERGNG